MNVAVVGSRDFPDLERVRNTVMRFVPGTVVVSGGARGVDSEAESAARKRGLRVLSFPVGRCRSRAEFARLAFERNRKIVAVADGLWAFWDGASRGTKNTMELARKKGIPMRVVLP